jgi:cytochrome c553
MALRWWTRFSGPSIGTLLFLASAVGADADLMQRPPWAACEYCHGVEGRIDSVDVPAIAGQSASYIAKQLADFRSGRRVSPRGQMRSAMFLLDAEDDAAVARYFAARKSNAPELPSDGANDPGAELFWYGSPENPACASCHAAARGALIPGHPRLFGLNRDYLKRQLRAFRDGSRANDRDGIMRKQAATLTDEQIGGLAAYLASGNPKSKTHMLFLDGVYIQRPDGSLRFCWVKAPSGA